MRAYKINKPTVKDILLHIEYLSSIKSKHSNTIINLINYWYDRIEKIEEEEEKRSLTKHVY